MLGVLTFYLVIDRLQIIFNKSQNQIVIIPNDVDFNALG